MILGLALLVCSHAFSQDFSVTVTASDVHDFSDLNLGAIKEDSAGFSKVEADTLQLSAMYFEDEFQYTLPNLGFHNGTLKWEWIKYSPNFPAAYVPYGTNFIVNENNPIASWFYKNNLSLAYFALSIGGSFGIENIFNDFDNQHLKGFPIKISDIISASLAIMEIAAIHTWASSGYGPTQSQWKILNLSV